MKSTFQCLFDVGVVTLIIGVALLIGFCVGVGWMQDKAAKAGAGHYTVNSTNGVTQFQFKAQK